MYSHPELVHLCVTDDNVVGGHKNVTFECNPPDNQFFLVSDDDLWNVDCGEEFFTNCSACGWATAVVQGPPLVEEVMVQAPVVARATQ